MENEAITAYRQRRAAFEATFERHLAAGVVFYSADGILIDDTVEIAPGAVILPHTLEASADAHATLREVARVLVPEGRVLIFGFNPLSLWGVQQWHHLFMDRLGLEGPPFIPDVDDFIGYHRLQDWLHLLNLDIDAGRFGCYRPGLHSQTWFDRLGWMEKAGDRWWPILGGVYFLQAVKRVRGVRMIQPRWKLAKLARGSMPVAQRRPAARRDMTP